METSLRIHTPHSHTHTHTPHSHILTHIIILTHILTQTHTHITKLALFNV